MLKFSLILIGFFLINTSYAQAPMRSATSEELIQKLDPNSPSLRTRGFRNLTPEAREKPTVDLSIQFEFDSARLLPESRPLLDNLAKAINSDKLRGFTFVVEGHTDIIGSADYNQKLSDQRALSVLAYLATRVFPKNV